MSKKIFIHIGLPKTASTTLQTNFFKNLKNTNYLGVNKFEKNTDLFNDLDNYISFNKNFNEDEIKTLKNKLLEIFNNSDKNLLLSQETWINPTNYYSRSLKPYDIKKSGRYYVFSQWKKLERLDKFLKSLNVSYQYFLVKRNLIDGFISLYFQIHTRIIDIFGNECRNIDFFVNKILEEREKNKNFDGDLIIDTFNIKKIIFFYEKILKNNIEILDYDDLQQNRDSFIEKLLNILEENYDETTLKIYSSYFSDKLNYKEDKLNNSFDKNITKTSYRARFPFLIYVVKYMPKQIYNFLFNIIHFININKKTNLNLNKNLKEKLSISNQKIYNEKNFEKYFQKNS